MTRTDSMFSQTHKVGNNGINANFVLPCICSFLHYLELKMLVQCGIRYRLAKGITFQGWRLFGGFFGLLNFEWHSQNEIDNIGILEWWKACEKTTIGMVIYLL